MRCNAGKQGEPRGGWTIRWGIALDQQCRIWPGVACRPEPHPDPRIVRNHHPPRMSFTAVRRNRPSFAA
jgi:hypothetical protein